MIVLSFLSLTLLLALLALRLIRQSLHPGEKPGWERILLALSLSAFIYLYGAWIYLSAYSKYVFALSVLLTGLISFVRHRRAKKAAGFRRHAARHVGLSLVLLIMVVLYFTGTAGRTRYVQLRFPLQGGRYFVLQGGKGLPANVFHYSSRRSAYAMDIVRLDKWGRRCRKVLSANQADYFIFGDTVYSPCDGMVQRAVSDNPDNIPPNRARGPHNLNGVVVEGPDCTVFLGHMQQDKVFVHAGQAVRTGQPLGLAGNSGLSLEPHLHIQAHVKGTNGEPWYKQPQLFMTFNDKEYLLFEEIDATGPAR